MIQINDMGTLIDGQPPDIENIRFRFRCDPAQTGAHTGDQLRHAKGLDDIIICTEIKAFHFVVFRAFCCNHNDGNTIRAFVMMQF